MQFNVMPRTYLQNNLIFRLLKPVPGIEIDPSIPDGLALRVIWMGPSRIDLVNDLIPRSVMLTPAMVLSKLKAERLVMTIRINGFNNKLQRELLWFVINLGKVTCYKPSGCNIFMVDGFT